MNGGGWQKQFRAENCHLFLQKVPSDIFAKVLNTSLYYDHIRQHQELTPHYFRDTTSFTSTTSLIPF